jgi:flagellin
MGLRINTNVQSLRAQTSVSKNEEAKSNTLAKLSSGSRINKAGDDAAGLAISEKLKAEIRGSLQANRNAGDGISMIQTAEGGLNETSNILIRLRELSVQSASDTIGEEERKFSNLEFQQLSKEIGRIAESTEYNGKKLLNGEGEDLDFQIGIRNNPNNDRLSYRPQESSGRPSDLGVDGLGVLTKADAQENLEKIDHAINGINGKTDYSLQFQILKLKLKTCLRRIHE